ncbi:hypothetical protein [Pseudomonas sp. LS-2]|uniref:hypothetical protein n=1 Tax=Pseudomonas sp. LS-2 TaxID=2315859 RepID=UPI000E72A001|nr:hypothetical protein [Pseudomonas sp. LS-2]RJX81184.1 hypothetical protein D3M70_08505 [Pseudomonas sp. LS-2]
MSYAPTEAVQHCETLLRQMMESFRADNIWPNVQSIIGSMLKRRIELVEVYEEVHASLSQKPRALYMFWDVFVHAADGWNPEKNRAARQAREDLIGVNTQISELADQLAALLDRRDDLHNYSGFSSNTQSQILDIVHEASEHNGHYESYAKEDVESLQYRYDSKYWPSLSEVIQAIGTDAEMAEVTANDPATEAATASRKSGRSDFVRAFLARIDDNRVRECGFISNSFALSDGSLASLVNCGLGLAVDELVDSDFIKRFRQRERQVKKAESTSA